MAIFNSYVKLPEGTEMQYLLEMSPHTWFLLQWEQPDYQW
jgi:hypothetical protein